MRFPTQTEAGDQLRGQAASCRRLSSKARTAEGATALETVARQFDTDADRIDPNGVVIQTPSFDDQSMLRVRRALERQATHRLRRNGPAESG